MSLPEARRLMENTALLLSEHPSNICYSADCASLVIVFLFIAGGGSELLVSAERNLQVQHFWQQRSFGRR